MRVVKVRLGARSYSIWIGRNQLGRLGRECVREKLGRRCAVISDENVAPLYAKTVLENLAASGFDPLLITVPAGERAKSMTTVQDCYDQLASHRLERRSFVVALGGGVVGDLAGFVAATYLRGVPFVQIPTTLLAQVDSSVGGKVGVNLKAGKNLVGAFHQPRFVLCELKTLETLPTRQFQSGLAEVIKYGIIYDARMFRLIEQNIDRMLRREDRLLELVVARSCTIKAAVVGQDETELGLRAILNFGHTIGHALEAISGYGKFLHGEAISLGQVAAAELSRLRLGLPSKEVQRIQSLLARAGLPTCIKLTRQQTGQLLAAMRLDKKVSEGVVKFVLAKTLGQAEFGQAIPVEQVEEAIRFLSVNRSIATEPLVFAKKARPPRPNL